jgi:hypothetical protein
MSHKQDDHQQHKLTEIPPVSTIQEEGIDSCSNNTLILI